MANLTHFLEPESMADTEVSVRARKDFKELEELREVCGSFLRQGIFAGGALGGLSRPEEEIVEREKSIMLGIWQEHKFLPMELANSVLGKASNGEVLPYQREIEPLVRFSALPRTRLSYIRNAAERLSFAIVPYEYINQDGIVSKYAEEGQKQYAQEIREGFKDINELCAAVNTFEKIEVYILCPIGFYDPWQEVRDEQIKQKIFGGELSSIAMFLGIMMPTQKNLFQMSKANAESIEQLRGTMEQNLAEVKKALDNIQGQISWLTEVMGAVRREAAQAANMASVAFKRAEQAEYRLMSLLDPLIFAVPRGTDLYNGDADAHLLMCFGADMPLDFFLRRGLVRVNDNGCYDSIVRVCK